MIEVSNLSKNFAGVQAVRDISFNVQKGEIVGFLGPNGAGKSTTMRILSGYLPPSDGSVKVAGFDVMQESLAVRARIGYMPENNPLYPDMRVDEFLRFRARLKRVKGQAVRENVDQAVDLCHLGDVRHRIIGTLSKGYRQRVGLADSLVHEPDLLILDEPTIGLDPHQIRSVRELIKRLGEKHTILLSTHILPEVTMTCSRVVIINHGRIEASDTPENLTRLVSSRHCLHLEVSAEPQDAESIFKQLDVVDEVAVETENNEGLEQGWCRLRLYGKPHEDARDAVFAAIRKADWRLREMRQVEPSLEDAFLELTQD